MSEELRLRVRTAGILIVFFTCLLTLASYLYPVALLLRIIAFGLVLASCYEAISVVRRIDQDLINTSRLWTFFALPSTVMFLLSFSSIPLIKTSLFVIAILPTIWMAVWFRSEDLLVLGNSLGRYLPIAVLFGVGGVSLIAISAAVSSGPELSVKPLVWLIMIVVATDTSAYFIGRKVGGPKLAPAISPGKTVSGGVGAIIGAVLAVILLNQIFPLNGATLSTTSSALLGILAGAGAQLGDLNKSYFKRVFGVKDFGSLLPGHGGVLDRIDGILGSASVLLAVVFFFS